LKLYLYSFILICFANTLFGQNLQFSYHFDDCGLNDASQNFPSIKTGGNPICVCGIGENSFQLDGSDDYFEFDSITNALFSNNFTLDFYFSLDKINGDMDIMSLRSGCGKLDSLMQLRYFSNTNELVFEIGSNINNFYAYKSKLDINNCWHRFALVKFGLEYQVFLDNKLTGKFIAKENIVMTKTGRLNFGNNPCNAIDNANRFKGRIDEIQLRQQALSDIELKHSFKYPDRIITPNTTIFSGESITLETGVSCAKSILWKPSTTLSDASVSKPIASPEQTTTYQVTFDNGTCQSIDTVKIFIADKERLDCKNLLLPKAFTPNNDGLNDTYGISNTHIVEKLDYFEIYDRWGGKVWETKELQENWDGTKNATPLNSGTYLYKIKYQCSNQEYVKFENFVLMR